MDELFLKCIKIILKNEGGYCWHKDDPGGETNFGITKARYPNLDIKNLTKEEATEIYYRDYWKPMKLNILNNEDLILHVFDMGVNAGIRTAIKLLQRLVGVTADGHIGLKTAGAVADYNGDVAEEYIKRRKLFYVTLVQEKPQLRVFIKGWLKRIEHTKFD